MYAKYAYIFSGGRFKKEIVIDSQSYLLLIRDEAGLPEQQVRMNDNVIST